MPILIHQHLEPEGELGIWQITETEAWFRDRLYLYPPELRQLGGIKGRRRVEWLGVRHLVHHMSGREQRGAFVKDEYGKPHLEHSLWQISISHSGELAAAIAAPTSVGIDIQRLVGKIGRIAHRFMRPEEMECLSQYERIEHIHLFWGAKEALYKAYGRRQLHFQDNILIQPFELDWSKGVFYGEVIKDDHYSRYELRYRMIGPFVLVYAIEQTNAQN
ncbi:MAG: 4'-phosphopantetheinyl transferase superfamily protein [Saprospiraceae bacterium]